MLKVTNYKVSGLAESIVRSGYPMRKEPLSEEEFKREVEDLENYFNKGIKSESAENNMKRAKKLGTAKIGSGHDSFLKGIVVQFDVRYAVYWTPQAQRYSFLDIISSQSSMHRIIKMNLDTCFNEYVLFESVNIVKELIEVYNKAIKEKVDEVFYWKDENSGKRIYSTTTNKDKVSYSIPIDDLFMMIISNCPQGLEKTMGMTTNYLQLKTICKQREFHKLKDWRVFVNWCKTLPYFKQLTGIGLKDNSRDLAVGCTFEVNNELYSVELDNSLSCDNCDLCSECRSGLDVPTCVPSERSDRKCVVFKKVKNV